MSTRNEHTHNTAVNSAVAPLAREKECKTSWYSALKENPDALAKHKEHTKRRYEIRKQILKALEDKGVVVQKATPGAKIDPERKKRHSDKYYSTHRDAINNHQRKRYHEIIKTSPEMLERERIRIRLYQQQKSMIPEERERKTLYAREHRKNSALRRHNTLNIDAEASTRASDSEEH